MCKLAIEWDALTKFVSFFLPASRRLRDLIRQPFDLYRAGVIDEYFMGMSNQVAQAMDDSVTQEVCSPSLLLSAREFVL